MTRVSSDIEKWRARAIKAWHRNDKRVTMAKKIR